MPYKSKRQQRKFHAMLSRGEISPKVVAEYDSATKGHYQDLPEHVPAKRHRVTRKKR